MTEHQIKWMKRDAAEKRCGIYGKPMDYEKEKHHSSPFKGIVYGLLASSVCWGIIIYFIVK